MVESACRTSHGQNVYYVKSGRKGYPPQSAIVHKRGEVRSWAQMRGETMAKGHDLLQVEAKRYTLLVSRESICKKTHSCVC
jgi:hypothetical protein